MKNLNLIKRLWTDSHEKQSPQRFGRYAVMLMMLLTLGVGQMWADQNINKAYLKASFNGDAVLWDGSSDEYVYNGSGHDTYDLGTLTGDFVITYVSWRAYANWNNTTDFYLYYNKDGNGSSFPNNIKQNWTKNGGDDDYYPKTTSLSHTVASVTDGSGEYDFEHYFYADFGGCGGGNRSWLSNGGGNYHFTYKILPPDISSFSVSRSGYISGAGTSENPYIVEYNSGTLTLTVNGSKAHTDGNSTLKYWKDSGAKQNSSTLTVTGITSTSLQSVVVHAQCINNSDGTLVGTESNATIYYKAGYAITPVAKYTTDGSTYTTGTTGGTVTINGSSSAIGVVKDATYSIVATPASGYCVEEIKVGETVAWEQANDNNRQTVAKTISTYTATADKTVTVKFARIQNITLHIHDGGIGGLVLQNATPKVGAHTVSLPNTTLTSEGNGWYYHTFDNVTSVTVLNVACSNTGAAAVANAGQPISTYTLSQTEYFSAIHSQNDGSSSICNVLGVSYTNQSYSIGSPAITLNPTYTLAPSGSPTYSWSVTSQPVGGAYSLSATDVASPTFSSTVEGTYTLKVQVTTGGCTKSTSFNVEVANGVPDPEISGATFVTNPILSNAHLQISITYANIPAEGCYIRLKRGDGYWNDENNSAWTALSSGSGSMTFTTNNTNVPTGTWTIELYNNAKNLLSSTNVTGSLSVLTAQTITISAGANGSVSPTTVYAGSGYRSESFTATPNDHYHFVNWSNNNSSNVTVNDVNSATTYVSTASAAATITANFAGDQYTITYYDQGGGDFSGTQTSAPTTHTYGTATTLKIPTKTGYAFGGWYTASNCASGAVGDANSASLGATAYTGNITLYAKWTAKSYDVSLNANGGSGAGVTVSATYDAAMPTSDKTSTALVAPTKAGYTFAGYYDDPSSGTKYYNANLTSAHIWDKASTATLYAHWTERLHKKVYFAKPADWTHVYAYVWNSSNESQKNADWPGKQLDAATPIAGTGTEVINCATYYYYKYYTDGGSADGEGLVGNSAWDRVIFNNGDKPGVANNTKTSDLTITTGKAYGVHTGMQSTSASGYATSAKWTLRGSFNSWSSATYPFSCSEGEHSYSVLVEGLTASTNYSFKIWGPDGVAYKYTGGKDESHNPDYSVTSLLDGRDLVLNEYASNNNTFTTATTSYRFTLDVTDPKHPVLTIVPGDDADYSVTMAVSGHGKITTPGTGSKTIHRYAPTTITAVADPGYRFTGWTVDGAHSSYVTFNASSLSTNVTGVDGAAGATITANFSNDGFVYFDASAVSGFSGGGKVYVTYLKRDNALSWDDGEGKTGALIVKNWISDDLHNQEMTRIPNTNIYYFYTSTTPQGKILFTSKSHAGTDYKLWEMAAVVREDFNVGKDNMFVAENWVLKDKNKTGYYDGYWMKYNESDPGVKLEIYSMGAGTPRISGSPFSFTRTEEGSRIYTTKVTGLTANTQYGIEILGNNGTYYKNSGEMTSTNATGGWDYVDRQPTRGTIRTTAAGDYDVQLSCSDKLILTVDFPLAVNDYQVVYSGLDSVGGSSCTNSTIIRHIGDVGSKKDTVSFFVVKGDSWTLQLQKCTAVSPEITWANVGTAKTASDFGTPETGVYNFVVKQDSATETPVTPAFATMTPEAYTGNYYIRTDAADGGWEAYKKSMDNRMVFSNYSKQHSGYDYYHCKYMTNGKNVKFCIANDYCGSLSVIKTTDTYVTNEYGNLPAAANIRFMYNSETNVVSRAYLNGSSTTDFLILAAKNDSIKEVNGTAISKSGDYNQVKFEDKNNWVYQKEVQALEGTHVRLTSNYYFSSANHLQYFIGSAGDWTPAHTELLIGGTTANSWQNLRLVYDFKTNHLTAAWLPPTTDITTAKHIEADMLLIRTCQNAAQQLTFNGGSVADVKTMVGAIELRYDSIVGRVNNFNGDSKTAGGNRAYRELMYYISFPFDVAVSDIYGFGQLNKEWYLQYYDGAERASKGWFKGDGTTTFWKFMTLSDTLKANVGYSLLLDNDYFNTTGDGTVWNNLSSGSKIYLYFPSAKELSSDSIIASDTKSITVPSHECTINRTFTSESGKTVNHKFTDSHWNMMGVPLFQNQTINLAKQFSPNDAASSDSTEAIASGSGYFFEWDSINNALKVKSSMNYEFKSMHAYMVQFCGSVTFTGSSIQPASVAARRTKVDREDYTLELQLLRNNNDVSRTYIELRDEACDTFALNEDVYMMYSSLPANLYTFAGNYDVSANVLSVANHTIPVGLTVRDAGTYTFSMPSNFSGGVTLVDNVLNTRTNLALSDYEVTLPKGVCEGRFALEIDVNKTPTSIDVIEDGGSLRDGKAHKFIMNGQMYILKNGELFDATGRRVK